MNSRSIPRTGVVMFVVMLAYVAVSVTDTLFPTGFDYIIIPAGILVFGLFVVSILYNHFVRKFTKEEKDILRKQTSLADALVAIGLVTFFLVHVADRLFSAGYHDTLIPIGVVVVIMSTVKVIADVLMGRSLTYDLGQDTENRDYA